MRAHEMLGLAACHRHAGKGVAHHLAVSENPLLENRNVVLGRRTEDQPRRRQDDDGLLEGSTTVHLLAIEQFAG